MHEQDTIAAQLRFYGLDDETCSFLKQNKPYIMTVMPEALDAFYEHIAAFPEAARFFRTREHMRHARDMQLRHWDLITNGDFGAHYVESVTKVGEVHNRIGLEPKWHIGGYNFLLGHIIARIARDMRGGLFSIGSTKTVIQLQQAVVKAVMLDMDIAIAVYLDAGRRERRATLEGLATTFESSVGTVVSGVLDSSVQMRAIADDLTASARETSEQSSAVAAAAEEAATNVSTVAKSAEELGASVQEIDRQVTQSVRMSDAAVADAKNTAGIVTELAEVAGGISDIVDTISKLASQTNLLALNATIEAARAGEMGRGFAVVASEVKELASQTARATTDITAKIAAIQTSTGKAVAAINGIAGTIHKINDVSAAIAMAVEQQTTVTREIVQSMTWAAAGTTDVTSTITSVAEAARKTGAGAVGVQDASTGLAAQVDKLRLEVRSFLDIVRAA